MCSPQLDAKKSNNHKKTKDQARHKEDKQRLFTIPRHVIKSSWQKRNAISSTKIMFEPVCYTGSVYNVNLPVTVRLKDVLSTVVSETGVQPSNIIRKIMSLKQV